MIRKVVTRWKKFALKVSEIQVSIFLVFFYLVILLPLGYIFRLFSDSFHNKKAHPTQWLKKKKEHFLIKDLESQY